MLKYILSSLCIISNFCVYAQTGITSNGNYVFVIEDKSKNGTGSTLVVLSTVTSWKRELKKGYSPQFTKDDHYLICKSADSVIVLELGTSNQQTIAKSESYAFSIAKGNTWLAVLKKGNILLLKNLQKKNETEIDGVINYWFTDHGSVIFITQRKTTSGEMLSELHLKDLVASNYNVVWSGKNCIIENVNCDYTGTCLAFTTTFDDKSSAFWFYKTGFERAISITGLLSEAISKKLSINTDPIVACSNEEKPFVFTESGKMLLFYMQEKLTRKISNNYVDIWSYTDGKCQDAQLRDANIPRKYAFCFDTQTMNVVRLEEENEKIAGKYAYVVSQLQINDNYAIVYHISDDIFTYGENGVINEGYSLAQYNWNKKTNCDVYLLSLKDGTRKLLKGQAIPTSSIFPRYWLSPKGKYIVSAEGGDYFIYEIGTGSIRDIGKTIPEVESLRSFLSPGQLLKWVNDTSVIIKDSYSDLWQINLVQNTFPINITNGFFKRAANGTDKTIFRLNPIHILQSKNGYPDIIYKVTCANRYINDGYYLVRSNNVVDPQSFVEVNTVYNYDFFQKAEKNETYLVRKQNAEEPPRYFYTSDFRKFYPVTSSEPDERGQGVKTEVVTWKTFDGTISQGVLYKPRDFDSTKKYPIIFSYYESKSQPHNVFRPYGLGDFVDYGYLVFSPDISYTIGQTGQSAYNSIVSAAEFLSKRRYVDKNKMGIRGASFGGYETNYLVTHTKLFAAAISSSGYSDFISNIGTLDNGLRPHQLEGNDQNRLGVTMWQRPDIWIKNSPIFYSDRVSTPLLLIHSQSDNNVPFEQNVAFFKALRSLGKKVWMLQYDQAGHIGVTTSIVGKPGQDCDMCIRQLQFFNHYLKGVSAPKWMLDGIPARLKGIEKGLELDSTGRKPGSGLAREKLALTPQQKELLEYRTMVTNDGRIIDIDKPKKVTSKPMSKTNL